MLSEYQLRMPRAVYGGAGALDRLGELLRLHGTKRLAVFTDRGVAAAGLLERPLEQVRRAGAQAVILDDVPLEPTYGQVQRLAERFFAAGANLILAVGGGSVMDAAKLASVLEPGVCGVKDLLDDPLRARKRTRTILIPTTAGTGAEATPNAIVAVPEREVKVGIVSPAMLADDVILDGEMVRALPRKIAAATGVDALAHAIECYTGNKANPFSDLYALQALDMILRNIEAACDDPEAVYAKGEMLLASFYAGVAITASGTTAVHALSYPLGGKYHIAHGVSNAMLLSPVMRFNEPACRARLAAAYDRCAPGADRLGTPEEKSGWIIGRLEEIVRHLDIPVSLTAFGVPREDLETLVEAGMGVTRLLSNNPRTVTAEDARRIYRQIL